MKQKHTQSRKHTCALNAQTDRAATASKTDDSTGQSTDVAIGATEPGPSWQTLCHVTINTGHACMQPRSVVTTELVQFLGKWLRSAKQQKIPGTKESWLCAPIPAPTPAMAMITREGDCLMVTVHHRAFGPCVSFGVAPNASEGVKLWKLLGGRGPQPQAPWCGVHCEIGLALAQSKSPRELTWLGDFERCLGWTWLQMLEQERTGRKD